MCSLNDLDDNCENVLVPDKSLFREDTPCRSCNDSGLVVLRRKDVYCKECFLAAVIHKFRATLGKSKMMKPHDKVLVAFSGSQSSEALLHLLHAGVNEEQHKKLLFSVVVMFIDEGNVIKQNLEEREKMVQDVKAKTDKYKFPMFFTTLSECFSKSPIIDTSLIVNARNDYQLLELFENIQSMTSKQDLLYSLKQKLLFKAAERLNCTKIFTAECGTDLAIKLLNNFSLGRGDQASFETGFCDSRNSQIKILRPLRDFTKKEVVFYNKFNNIESINISSLTTKLSHNCSIRKLTEKFVTDLQEEFPSTVYTIFRTGEKLSVNEGESDKVCLLCKNKIRISNLKDDYSAVEAAKFSRNVSRKKLMNCSVNGMKNCCGSCEDKKKMNITDLEIEKYLCYGCSLIVRDLKNIECLPKDLLRAAVEKRDFDDMKEQISEFLLEPSSELEV